MRERLSATVTPPEPDNLANTSLNIRTLAQTGQHAPPIYITLSTTSRWGTHHKLIHSLLSDKFGEKSFISPLTEEVFFF